MIKYARENYFTILAIVLVCLIGVAIYSNTFNSSFHFDDYKSIADNVNIRNIFNIKSIWDFWPTRFITYFTFALNYHFGQLNVFGYHLFNLLVHLACAVFVWWFAILALQKRFIAFFAALIFIVHPIQTQAVTYIVQRAVSLAVLFYLAALCFYIKFRFCEKEGRRVAFYIVSLLSAVMAVFTKEMAITLPFMILLYEALFIKSGKEKLRWGYVAPYFLLLLILPLMMLRRIQESTPGIFPLNYLFTQFRVIITYIRLLFFPVNQNLNYEYKIFNSFFDMPVLISFCALGLILTAAVRMFKKYRIISFSIFWFFLTLLPESSIIPIRDVIFEHRLYLPMVGYSLILPTVIYYIFGRSNLKIAAIILIIISACYSAMAYNRNLVWSDEFTLWSDGVNKSPSKAGSYNNLGAAYYEKGDSDQAIINCSKAIEINPGLALAYFNRGQAYEKKGDLNSAFNDYTKTVELDPASFEAYNGRGYIYLQRRNKEEALVDFSMAIKINPYFARAYYNRAVVYADKNDIDSAIADYSKAIEIDPKYGKAYYNRALLYFVKKDYGICRKDVHKAQGLGYSFSKDFIENLEAHKP